MFATLATKSQMALWLDLLQILVPKQTGVFNASDFLDRRCSQGLVSAQKEGEPIIIVEQNSLFLTLIDL